MVPMEGAPVGGSGSGGHEGRVVEEEASPPGPCPRVTRISDQLCVGGLGGGLSTEAIECLLQEHSVTHLVVCGHRGTDAHVDAAEAAAASCGAELYVSPLVPSDASLAPGLLEAACAFVDEALEDDLSCVLVACSKGASRSVAVVLTHLMKARRLRLEQAFAEVARLRSRIWPSALLVEALLQLEAKVVEGEVDRNSVVRRIGSHAAWATAWHNRRRATLAEARAAWEEASKEGGSLEDAFRSCKQLLLGLEGTDLASYHLGRIGRPPHAEVCEVEPGLLLCGLGGLSAEAVGELLKECSVAHAVVCGRPDRDKHVAALTTAMLSRSGSDSSFCVVPVADSAGEDLLGYLETTSAFIATALAGDRPGKVLVSCRQGASRSATAVVAHLMLCRNLSALASFRLVAAKRWRLWPNAGFAEQLLRLEDALRIRRGEAPLAAEQRTEALRAIGVHAAWAANRQNLEECGVGRAEATLEDVGRFWEEAVASTGSLGECFERCKALTLGVDLAAFDGGDWPAGDATVLPPMPA
eukprot:CAMPEP_0203915550 /NCGR_PEP_ID=MMETSP0359-20131031/56347_1 /ASSEMBLY_ACC=CAM_ASM_000338 /TAXON_ID=268821 /ORGANISM="Scrippsiella Hangoei, Strain SHTV-5" /LENGTH=526 /DNA_ID=CAMNT_0050842083 /DNA_START=35 /DNA_END=1611 /DNA_ORIENTATION=-